VIDLVHWVTHVHRQRSGEAWAAPTQFLAAQPIAPLAIPLWRFVLADLAPKAAP